MLDMIISIYCLKPTVLGFSVHTAGAEAEDVDAIV